MNKIKQHKRETKTTTFLFGEIYKVKIARQEHMPEIFTWLSTSYVYTSFNQIISNIAEISLVFLCFEDLEVFGNGLLSVHLIPFCKKHGIPVCLLPKNSYCKLETIVKQKFCFVLGIPLTNPNYEILGKFVSCLETEITGLPS